MKNLVIGGVGKAKKILSYGVADNEPQRRWKTEGWIVWETHLTFLPSPLPSNLPPMLDLSQTEKPNQVRENLIAYMGLFRGLPGVTIHDESAFWIYSGQGAPGNSLLRTQFSAETAEQEIDATLAAIAKVGEHMDWWVISGDTPPDLGARLERRGMVGNLAGNWLWRSLEDISDVQPKYGRLEMKRVANDQELELWIELSERGFDCKLPLFRHAYRLHGYGRDAFSDHYLGFAEGECVVSGTVLKAGGTMSIYDLSTPPEHRGKGYGGAMTYEFLKLIRSHGFSDTWIWGSNMAKSLYMEFGFRECDFGIREYPWHRA